MRTRRLLLCTMGLVLIAAGLIFRTTFPVSASQSSLILSPNFQPRILSTSGESPLALRIFTTAVKTDSRGRIITGPTSDPVKNVVGAEPCGFGHKVKLADQRNQSLTRTVRSLNEILVGHNVRISYRFRS